MKDAVIGLTFDRSGSMQSMWGEAVEGYNAFKNEQAEADGKAVFITTYFDHEIVNGYDGKDAREIPDLTKHDQLIHPRGLTALIDATIRTIQRTANWLTWNKSFDGKVYQVIITDGIENASESSPEVLKELIKEKEAEGWEFIYLAANVDLDSTAFNYGLQNSASLSYDKASLVQTYQTTSGAVLRSRSGQDDKVTLVDPES